MPECKTCDRNANFTGYCRSCEIRARNSAMDMASKQERQRKIDARAAKLKKRLLREKRMVRRAAKTPWFNNLAVENTLPNEHEHQTGDEQQ